MYIDIFFIHLNKIFVTLNIDKYMDITTNMHMDMNMVHMHMDMVYMHMHMHIHMHMCMCMPMPMHMHMDMDMDMDMDMCMYMHAHAGRFPPRSHPRHHQHHIRLDALARLLACRRARAALRPRVRRVQLHGGRRRGAMRGRDQQHARAHHLAGVYEAD